MNKQEILNEIEKMENKLADFKQELNKTEEEWIPEYNEEYYFYNKDKEEIHSEYWTNRFIDNRRLKNKVIFKTEAEAQRYADYQKAKEKYSYEFSNEEWEDINLNKYFIFYDNEIKEIDVSNNNYWKCLGLIYFETRYKAQEFIDKYKDEILEFEFGIKEEK